MIPDRCLLEHMRGHMLWHVPKYVPDRIVLARHVLRHLMRHQNNMRQSVVRFGKVIITACAIP